MTKKGLKMKKKNYFFVKLKLSIFRKKIVF